MAKGIRKAPLQVGQTWEGKSKEATSMSRRKITALTGREVTWELIGHMTQGPHEGRCSVLTFRAWARQQVHR